ncbi:MAG: DUF2292 domain-containing protein [Deltaproteobacteria bacterium]|nr:DUF2292 domain-containing protein [Deltaproteobacteria bacterium]
MNDTEHGGLRLQEDDAGADGALGRIEAALRGLRFGTVTAVVQNGVVVQVERTEKVRLQQNQRLC